MGYNLGEQGESEEGFGLNRVRESVNRAIRTCKQPFCLFGSSPLFVLMRFNLSSTPKRFPMDPNTFIVQC